MSKYNSLLLVSRIPLHGDDSSGYQTFDLWQRDLFFQSQFVERLCIVAPLVKKETKGLLSLPQGIKVVSRDAICSEQQAAALAADYDVVQIGGGVPFWETTQEKFFLKAAKTLNKLSIVGVSSDRAATAKMNSAGRGIARRIYAWLKSEAIKKSLLTLTKNSAGVFLCGEALRELVHPHQKHIHIDTPSWISKQELLDKKELSNKITRTKETPVLRLCTACRLEKMKGVHLAIEALEGLLSKGVSATLAILGEGVEREALVHLIEQKGLSSVCSFEGSYNYPFPFLEKIKSYDAILLTNLNREQPRLVFDALSQGLLPLCPASSPYLGLNLQEYLYYSQGSSISLFETLFHLQQRMQVDPLVETFTFLREAHTIETMHQKRKEWIQRLLFIEKCR